MFLNTKVIRDLFLDFVEVISKTESNYAEVLTDYFEMMYNQLTCVKTFEPKAGSASDDDLDVFRNLMWELFICVIAFMRHIKDYAAINTMLTHTYFLETSIFGGAVKQNNYTAFRHHSHVVEERYKPSTDMKNKFTLMGDTICNQREKLLFNSQRQNGYEKIIAMVIFRGFRGFSPLTRCIRSRDVSNAYLAMQF